MLMRRRKADDRVFSSFHRVFPASTHSSEQSVARCVAGAEAALQDG